MAGKRTRTLIKRYLRWQFRLKFIQNWPVKWVPCDCETGWYDLVSGQPSTRKKMFWGNAVACDKCRGYGVRPVTREEFK